LIDTVTDRICDPPVTTRTERGWTIAVLTGALDITCAPALREKFLHLLRPASRGLVMDLSLVSHVDTGGLALLVGTGRRARLLGGSLRLAAATPAVSLALRVAGLDRLLETFPTVQSAVTSPARA
jgi:anti-sigma B factor antagonist